MHVNGWSVLIDQVAIIDFLDSGGGGGGVAATIGSAMARICSIYKVLASTPMSSLTFKTASSFCA